MRRCVCLLVALSTLAACDSSDSRLCPALGDEVLDLPLFSPMVAVDCEQGEWTDEVERLDDAETVELDRSPGFGAPLLLARGDGLFVVSRDLLLGLDGEGREQWRASYDFNAPLDHAFVGVGADGHLYATDSFGNDAKVVVFDGDSGQQLDQFIVDYEFGGPRPPLAFRGEELWLGELLFDQQTQQESVRIGRYDRDGALLDAIEVGGTWDKLPLVMRWSADGALLAGGTYSVYRADLGAAGVTWEVSDAQLEGTWAREMVVSGDLVVVASPALDAGYELGWRIAGYDIETGKLELETRLERARNQDFDLAALAGGQVVFVGREARPNEPVSTQPMIVVLDASGQLLAGERLAVAGAATSVVAAASGQLFVAGTTPIGETWEPEFTRSTWLRRYDPPLW